MKVLAAKEARLRHQAQHLERMTQAMQADAEAQRESLEQRLQCVLERKKRYMAQIVSKAQGEKSSSNMNLESEVCTEQSHVVDKESTEEAEEKVSKGQRKRAKKFKQRLANIRNAWQETEETAACARAAAPGSRLSKLSRLFSDVVKGAPAGEDLDKGGAKLRQPCRDLESMLRIFQEIHRLAKSDDTDAKVGGVKEDKDLLFSAIRKSGCIAAMIRLVCADDKVSFPRLLCAILKVLIDICADETNRLYIVSTGRLIPLVDKLDYVACSLCAPISEGDSFNLLRQLMVVVSICLRCKTETSIQAQARDDSLGYLVNAGILSKLERMIISVIRLIAACAALKAVDGSEAKNQSFAAHLKVLEVAVTLVESVTMCYETNGQIVSAVQDKGVRGSVVDALEDSRLVGLVPLLSTLFLDVKICTLLSANSDSCKETDISSGISKSVPARTCAVKALRALNNIAVLDLHLFQRALGSVVLCSEFSHVAMAILESCSSSAGLHSELSIQAGLSLPSAEMLHELILLQGYMAFSASPAIQSPFAGWRNGVKMLQQLCSLPLAYFIAPQLREVLMPTLIVATFRNSALLDAMRDQVSARLLATYLDHYQQCIDKKGTDQTGLPIDGLSKHWARVPPLAVPCRFHLANRFPRDKWKEAADWFREESADTLRKEIAVPGEYEDVEGNQEEGRKEGTELRGL